MKKFFLFTSLIFSSISFGQAHRFSDIGILFSQQELSGSSRYRALSGAMGALGGDISTIATNPAGLGVFNHHDFTVSLGTENKSTSSTYYGNTIKNDVYNGNLSQIGLAFVFEHSDPDWEKLVLAINYQRTNNFDNLVNSFGNSQFATFRTHPNVNSNSNFNLSLSQDFENETTGESSVFNIGIATQYKNKLYLGGSVNFHNIDYVQNTFLNERNNNNDGLILDALLNQYDSHIADGLSVNFGLIYKVNQFFRLGASYQSPTWYYNIINESNIFDGRNNPSFGRVKGNEKDTPLDIKGSLDISPINSEIDGFAVENQLDEFEYNLKTPNKFNISSAFIIGKFGLLALDYSYYNYSALNLGGDGSFNSENNYFTDILVNTHNIRGGGEIKLQDFTLRGGFSYEQSPFNENKTTLIDVIRLGHKYGASLGAGLRIENHKFDVSYNYTQQNNTYDFYDQYDNVLPTNIELKQSRVNFTYSYIF